ncbi:hypothetical protein [Umezawaea sp. NPDC059074]|uniref:hypothetical protein n=1 Tax=Umezawaea sp. NPDC059074 TaxID=3346716 RepID=UPI0036A05F01
MAQHRDRAERVSLGWFAAGLAGVATAVFGVVAIWGTGLRGVRLAFTPDPGPFWDVAWLFSALAWTSAAGPAAVAAWTWAGLTALVLAAALLTNGFRSASGVADRLVDTTAIVSFVPLLLLAAPLAAALVAWVVLWLGTGFGTCVPPECHPTPAVP